MMSIESMMILRSSPSSAVGRKIKLAAGILGITGDIKIEATDLNDPSDTIRKQNPLGKIPALIDVDGTTYFDSRVILEFLDTRAGGGKIIPRETKAHFDALRMQALCDGLLDAGVLIVYESRYRPAEMHVQGWIERQSDKIARGLAVLEAAPPQLDPMPHVGQIALACVLGYCDLRFEGKWRKDHPRLVAWLARFAAQVPAFEKTKVTA
jgi:glutathione S-transferase